MAVLTQGPDGSAEEPGKLKEPDSLSLTMPPFMKITLRMTHSRPIFELQRFLCAHTMSPADPRSQTDPSPGEILRDRASCPHGLQVVLKYVQVILGVNFRQLESEDLVSRESHRQLMCDQGGDQHGGDPVALDPPAQRS